jgi:hypothetical protein
MDRIRRRRDTPAEASARQQPLSRRNGSLGFELWCLQEGPFRASCPDLGHSVSSGINKSSFVLRYFASAAKRTSDTDLPVSEVLHLKELRSGQLTSSAHGIIKGPSNVDNWKLRCASIKTFDNAIHNVDSDQLASSACSIIQDPDDANV